MQVINVSWDNTNKKIVLSNNSGNAEVGKNGKVKWKINNNSDVASNTIGVASITIAVTAPVAPYIAIWTSIPSQKSDGSWIGTVGDNLGAEKYTVGHTLTNGSSGSFDPQITVTAGNI